MKMLVFITKLPESIEPILSDFLSEEIGGATVIDGQGMLKTISEANFDPPPIFGALRQFINPGPEQVKLLIVVLPDAKLQAARTIIHRHTGNLTAPNSGIMFEIPVSNVDGISGG